MGKGGLWTVTQYTDDDRFGTLGEQQAVHHR